MAGNKSLDKKKILVAERRKVRRIPVFVVARTKREVAQNENRRHRRQRQIKIRTILAKRGLSGTKPTPKPIAKKPSAKRLSGRRPSARTFRK